MIPYLFLIFGERNYEIGLCLGAGMGVLEVLVSKESGLYSYDTVLNSCVYPHGNHNAKAGINAMDD